MADIELMRNRFNPAQSRLIPAHVTLCREDEITDWNALQQKLNSLTPLVLTLGFGAPVRNDNFVYLPVCEGLDRFHKLRCFLLSDDPRWHNPHVTVIHPRNGTCTHEAFAEIQRRIQPFQYTFRRVMLIEQENGGVWQPIACADTIRETIVAGTTDEQTDEREPE